MKKGRFPFLSCFLVIAFFLCLAGLVVGGVVFLLPERAAREFGPSAPGLDPMQRIYLSAQLLFRANDLTLPADPYGAKRPFHIALGESTGSVARRLEAEGLITNSSALLTYLRYSGLDTTLQAGAYELSPSQTPMEIAQALQDATPREVTFNILPGWRLEEIASSLPTSGLEIRPEVFLQAAKTHPEGYSFSADLPPSASLEGFLFPGTYRLSRKLSADELITILLNNFEAQVSNDLRKGFRRHKLNLFEAVTLASIVEREAVVDEEMPLITSVFINRLGDGIKLDSDPTVQYALGYNDRQGTWWTNPLSTVDLNIDSPYNTYRSPGLPPGPIANPSLNALQAVAFPARTPYFFFRAACDGSGRHTFAETFDEHVKNECP